MAYDIFYISKFRINNNAWKLFSTRFPTAIKVENVQSIDYLRSLSFTKMFWIVWCDLELLDTFRCDFIVPEWDQHYIHVFKNDKTYNGIALCPKKSKSSNEEFFNRYFIEKKEIDIVASRPKLYDKFMSG